MAETLIDEGLITHVVNRIVERFHPNRVVLFGSYARGQAGPDSDIDLFIEMETPLRPPERAIAISRLFGLHPWSMDIVVYTPTEVARLRRLHGSFINIIEAEGKVLYECGKTTGEKPGQESHGHSPIVILNEVKDHV